MIDNKNILIVDDSIVRGNTIKYIIKQLRKTNVKKIFFASCSPKIKYPNNYGIYIPSKEELIAHNNSVKEIERKLNIDKLYYSTIQDIKTVLYSLNSNIKNVEDSSFTGNEII